MRIHNCIQGSSEWLRLRMGRPTASAFDRIITPTGKPSTAASGYANELIAELIMERPAEGETFPWMQRGKDLEAQARSYYAFMRDMEPETVGFVTSWDGRIGASPDALVGEHGLLEIKCPSPGIHVGYLLSSKGADAKYYPQLQGQLLVTGRQWVDILSYHPDMPEAIVRVERDPKYIETLTELLSEFLADLEAQRGACERRGWIVDREKVNCEPVPVEALAGVVFNPEFDEFAGVN